MDIEKRRLISQVRTYSASMVPSEGRVGEVRRGGRSKHHEFDDDWDEDDDFGDRSSYGDVNKYNQYDYEGNSDYDVGGVDGYGMGYAQGVRVKRSPQKRVGRQRSVDGSNTAIQAPPPLPVEASSPKNYNEAVMPKICH